MVLSILFLLHAAFHLCAVTSPNGPGLVMPCISEGEWAAWLGEEMLSREV